jgi:CBS domain-containing protein
MKASDIMEKKVDYVTPNTSLRQASKIIFGKLHMGLPVVNQKTKKLVGFITDQDILAQCFPSMKEYVEDIVHARDFSAMEKELKHIMSLKVKDVMSKQVIYVKKDEPLLKVESIMKLKDIARLPVVDHKKKLIGILTKRDIFRALVGKYF